VLHSEARSWSECICSCLRTPYMRAPRMTGLLLAYSSYMSLIFTARGEIQAEVLAIVQ
jgi:hypothetical protein